MNYRMLLLVFPLILITIPALAGAETISLTTDSSSYVSGDAIIVSGNVGTFIPNTPILIQIFYESNQVGVAQ